MFRTSPRHLKLGSLLTSIALLSCLSLWLKTRTPEARQDPSRSRASALRHGVEASGVEASRARAAENYGKLPLSFEANDGQEDGQVKFVARGGGYKLFLTESEMVLALRRPASDDCILTAASKMRGQLSEGNHAGLCREESATLRMSLEGANERPRLTAKDELPGKSNYFIGNDPSKWRTDVSHYSKVEYSQVYPGIDLVYYGNQRQVEYDFVVAPGAKADRIGMSFTGAKSISVDESGELVLSVEGGELRQKRPFTYQEIDGERREVASRYRLIGEHTVGFEVADYDVSKPLVIDPVLVYSTYLGGGNGDEGRGIAVDAAGNAYVIGRTSSTNFPTQNPFQASNNANVDVFVTKLNTSGSALIYSTYLGGSSFDEGRGITVDSSGNAYLTGTTASADFPTQNPIQPTNVGEDAFVTKIDASGSALVYSTYLGGDGGSTSDEGHAIAVDSDGNAYIVGRTGAADFPTQNPLQPTYGGGILDGFVTKINAAGTAFVYSTFLGGSVEDEARGVAADSAGNAYVTGRTASTEFPTQNPFQPMPGASPDAFITKIDASGSAFVYSTFLGGDGFDEGRGIAVDAAGNAYITGFTGSSDFPTQNPFQATGFQEVFVTKFNASGSALVYSTKLGGSNSEFGTGIAVDSAGNAYVTGRTDSTDFPTQNPLQPASGSIPDAFVTKFNASGSALFYSTYLGGSGSDEPRSIAVDSAGNAYVTGFTNSTNFPTQNALQPSFGGGFADAFVAKIFSGNIFTVTNTNDSGAGSLRQAILNANASPDLDSIVFDIPAAGPMPDPNCNAGVCTISPTSALPDITDPVIIDGYTQPGAQPNTLTVGSDAVLLIELNGSNAGVVAGGLVISAGGSTVRGLVINGFTGGFPNANGIRLVGGGSNVITGNRIGTNAAGTAAVSNSVFAIDITNSTGNIIGGTTPAARNLLSGNAEGVHIFNSGAVGNNVAQGNYIGTNAAGTAAIPNFGDAGVRITNSSGNTVGGTVANARNVISGNTTNGVLIDTSANNNTLQGNFIGTNASGTAALPNTGSGVIIGISNGNQIGGSAAGAGNVIANNGGRGVNVVSGVNNRIAGNSIFGNAALGIDLGNNGVTLNDACDSDSGPNNLQNFPLLTSAQAAVNSTTIQGTLNSAPNTQFTIEFFSNASCDPSENGEGRTFLGSTLVTTDGSCNATINETLPLAVAGGEVITATATDPAGNTSEFSQCRVVTFSGAQTFTVTNTNDSGAGSLRQAILDANQNAGTDTIAFNIPGAGVHTITPATVMPQITGPVIIDGYTQPGSSPNTLAEGSNAVLLIELSGPGGNGTGLDVRGGNSLVRGLIINRFFNAPAINLSTNGNNRVEGCFLGTDSTGTTNFPDQSREGVSINNSTGNTVGGLTPDKRNVISGHRLNGIGIFGTGAGNNVVQGNLIGLDKTGTASLGNGQGGINISGFTNTLIGGTTAAARNYISANQTGIVLFTGSNTVQGNYIGTDITGTLDRGNNGTGVFMQGAAGNLIGGLASAPGQPPGNLISGNGGVGIDMNGNAAGGHTFQGNLIGTNAAGTAAIPNGDDGINLRNTGGGNTVGGADVQARNVISGNGDHGISLDNGSNTIANNFIGTAADGASPLGNARNGVLINSRNDNAVTNNRIAFNGEDGIIINFFQSGTGNAILSNSIFANTQLGIDLGNNGVTQNDAGDADTGANNLQNFPVLTSAVADIETTTVEGTLNSTANTTFRVQFFSNDACDASGFGEGRTFIGETNVTTDASGNAPISAVLAATSVGEFITSTATDPANNTSEFSQCRAVTSDPGPTPTFSISGRVTENGEGRLGVNITLSGSASRVTTTDENGNYSFTNLPQGGNYTITPFETGFQFTPQSRTINNLSGNVTGQDFEAALVNHTITGRIVDQEGRGIPDVAVTLAGSLSRVVRTDQDGNFVFGDVPTRGSFTITPEKEGFDFNPPRRTISDISQDEVFQAVGTPNPNPTPTPNPSDDFSGPVIDPERWSIGILTNEPTAFDPLVQVFQRDGLLHIQPRADANGPSFNGLVTARALDLDSTPIVSVEVVQPASGEGTQTIFGLGTDSDNYFRFVVEDGTGAPANAATKGKGDSERNTVQQLLFELSLGGGKVSSAIGYNPAQHRFWRFRYNAPASVVLFETSPDSSLWTERFRADISGDRTRLIAELSAGTLRKSSNPIEALFDNFLVMTTPRVQFSSDAYSFTENSGEATIDVLRLGSAESSFTIDFATSDGTARAGEDYLPVTQTLTFGVGERTKSVTIPLINDTLVEGTETILLRLSNPVGGGLGTISTAIVNILDDDGAPSNPIDDTRFFVEQHYRDFLGRAPDEAGLQFWVNIIEQCGANVQCRQVNRVNVSAAFYLSIEFQQTGSFITRLYEASFDRPPTFLEEYTPDLAAIREGVIVGRPGWEERLAANQRQFLAQWVTRPQFRARFDQLNEMQYVDRLFANAGVVPAEEERTALIVSLLTQRDTRAGVLEKIVQNEAFIQREFTRTFVRMQYFGYLRRDPDEGGFQFWLTKLNDFGGDFVRAEMVRAFIESFEYRGRFGRP